MSQDGPLRFDKPVLVEALLSVAALFPSQSKVTLVVYQPDRPDGDRDLVFTDGEILEVRRRQCGIPELLKKRPKETADADEYEEGAFTELTDESEQRVPGEYREQVLASGRASPGAALPLSMVVRLVPKPGAAERLERQTRCDHKFVDSKHCLKCGWSPPERGPSA